MSNEKAVELGEWVRKLVKVTKTGKISRRTDLICWALRELGGLATKSELADFWRTVRGGRHTQKFTKYGWTFGKHGELTKPKPTKRLVYSEQLQGLMTTAYGGVADDFLGKKLSCRKHMQKYGETAPFWRTNPGQYALTVNGLARAMKGDLFLRSALEDTNS
jgi:hypothetical protein